MALEKPNISAKNQLKRKFEERDSDSDNSINTSQFQKVQKGLNSTMDQDDDNTKNDLFEKIEKLEKTVSEQNILIETLVKRIEKLETIERGFQLNNESFPRLETKNNENEVPKLKCAWTKDVSKYLKSVGGANKTTKTKIELVEGVRKREIDRTRTLIAFGIEESVSKEDDVSKVEEIIKEIGVQTDKIEQIYRFKGRENAKSPPPIRITMISAKDKNEVMKAAYKLKTNFPSIWLKQDLTWEELKERKELEELRYKQEQKLKEEHGEHLKCIISKKKELIIVINKKKEPMAQENVNKKTDAQITQEINDQTQTNMEIRNTEEEEKDNEMEEYTDDGVPPVLNAKKTRGRKSNAQLAEENKMLKKN